LNIHYQKLKSTTLATSHVAVVGKISKQIKQN
jgi:hypothetical protein